jgi:hypothetical protein
MRTCEAVATPVLLKVESAVLDDNRSLKTRSSYLISYLVKTTENNNMVTDSE